MAALTRLDEEIREILVGIVDEEEGIAADDRVEILRALTTEDEDEAALDDDQMTLLRQAIAAADLDEDEVDELLALLREIED
jgi:hypothetical protein